jgi:hypothetical protein
MTVAQGVAKQLAYKKQTAKGSAASGSGGQLLRRETATFSKKRDTYSANEITSHQQHTGDTHGIAASDATINGLLSPGTYKDLLASLLRKDMTATSDITGLSITVAGTGPYTLTDASATFLTDGIKNGDVVRLTAGSFAAGNDNNNLLVTAATETQLTVIVVNGSDMTAEGPIASATLSVPGKKTRAPTSGHTNDYYTFEEWYSDISKSHTWPDAQVAKADIGLPSTGNATINFNLMGLGQRTKGASQVLTSPTAETSTAILAAIRGVVMVGGTQYATVTSAQVSIDGGMSAGEAVIGSNYRTDNQRGTMKVSGTLTILYEDDTVGDIFDNEGATSLVLLSAEDASDDAEFVTFSMSRVKIFGDDADDGKKQIVRSYPFTAEINGAGGAALANDQTICSIQDSAA